MARAGRWRACSGDSPESTRGDMLAECWTLPRMRSSSGRSGRHRPGRSSAYRVEILCRLISDRPGWQTPARSWTMAYTRLALSLSGRRSWSSFARRLTEAIEPFVWLAPSAEDVGRPSSDGFCQVAAEPQPGGSGGPSLGSGRRPPSAPLHRPGLRRSRSRGVPGGRPSREMAAGPRQRWP